MARDRPIHPSLRRAGRPGRVARGAGVHPSGPGNAARVGAADHGSEQQRQQLLTHIASRLGAIQSAQQREVAATAPRAERDWWREVADSHVEHATKPDPARWHQAARLFSGAADALSRGDLARGLGLLRMAEDAEREAFDTTSSAVDLDGVTRPAAEPERRTAAVGVLRAVALPESIRLTASRIETTDRWVADPPVKPIDARRAPPTAEQDDEEADGTATGG